MLKGSISTKQSIINHFEIDSTKSNTLIDDQSINTHTFDDYNQTNTTKKVNYNPESMFYNYLIDEELDLRKESIKNMKSFIIFYNVNLSGLKPFLEFNLFKVDKSLDLFEEVITNGEIPHFDNYKYNGLLHFDKNQYLFYKYNDTQNSNVYQITSSRTSYWTTLDDIINLNYFYNFTIGHNIYSFLINNLNAIYLTDENDDIIETPTSAYRGGYYKTMGIVGGLGMPRCSPFCSLGPFFYFGNYDRALRYAAITTDGKPKTVMGEKLTIKDTPVFKKGGVVKFVLFMGKTKVMLNLPLDPKDDSLNSLELANKRPFIESTLKLRDSDGKWAQKYSSVVQPDVYIYDKELNLNRKLDAAFIVKYYKQQLPINYAYFKTDHIEKSPNTTFYNVKDLILI